MNSTVWPSSLYVWRSVSRLGEREVGVDGRRGVHHGLIAYSTAKKVGAVMA